MIGHIRSENTNYFYWFELDNVVYNGTTQIYTDYGYGGGSSMITVVIIESTEEPVDDKDIIRYAEKFLTTRLDKKKSQHG